MCHLYDDCSLRSPHKKVKRPFCVCVGWNCLGRVSYCRVANTRVLSKTHFSGLLYHFKRDLSNHRKRDCVVGQRPTDTGHKSCRERQLYFFVETHKLLARHDTRKKYEGSTYFEYMTWVKVWFGLQYRQDRERSPHDRHDVFTALNRGTRAHVALGDESSHKLNFFGRGNLPYTGKFLSP